MAGSLNDGHSHYNSPERSCSARVCFYVPDREQSTKERKFHRNTDPKSGRRELQLHWLQPGNQAVGDQVFDAFAYNDLKNPLSQYVFSSKDKNPKSTTLVWVAIVITMGDLFCSLSDSGQCIPL
jgi:hypothetical protein